MVPYILFELILQFLFQTPLPFINKIYSEGSQREGIDEVKTIVSLIGLKKFWIPKFVDQNKLPKFILNNEECMELFLKALILFFVRLQVRILNSKSFTRLKDIISLGKKKGKAITWRFNNIKIKKYMEI